MTYSSQQSYEVSCNVSSSNNCEASFGELDPERLILQMSAELDIAPREIKDFKWEGRTAKRFRQEIRNYFGYREATDNDSKQFIEYLMKEMLPMNYYCLM